MSDWDLYKENIQPRRRGHTAAELANLSKLSDPEFVAQRQVEAAEWEAKLRVDNLVGTWCAYIEWAEQNLYTQLQLNELRQKTLAKFINLDEYADLINNEQLFTVFLQSTDDSRNWRDMFSFVRSKGFFLGLATFWCHWAERFELEDAVKDADRVLAEGHSLLHTRELRKLEKWRADFDLRIASGMSRQVDAETTNAPVATIRAARRGLSEIKVKRAEKETEKAKKKQTKMTIFNDANPAAADEHVAGLQGDWNRPTLPGNRPRNNEKENLNRADKWTGKISAHATKTRPVITKARVAIFGGNGDDGENKAERPVETVKPISRRVLRETTTHTKNGFMELMLEGSVESGKERAMYRKKEVYLGLTEMSFEELRAQTWQKFRNAKTPTRVAMASMRDADDQLIVKPIKFCDENDDSFFGEQRSDEAQPDDDLVCGLLPDTPVRSEVTKKKESAKKSKFAIFGD